MAVLRSSDYRGALETIQLVTRAGDSAEFARLVVERVAKHVPSDVVTLNEVDPVAGRVRYAAEPEAYAMPPDAPAILARHADAHPLIRYVAETGDGSARRISDFLSRAEFHASSLYELLYREMGVEYQVALTLAAPLPIVVAVAASRSKRDFSDREQALLELLRPHLSHAWRTAYEQQRVRMLLAAASDGLDRRGSGVIVLWQPPQELVPGTIASVLGFFGVPKRGHVLPLAVEDWLAAQAEAPPGDAHPTLARPLVGRVGLRRLILHYVPPSAHHPGAIMVDEARGSISIARLQALRLSHREAQVARLAIEGVTNPEIGARLQIASGTVKKHLENIYRKLGVGGRLELAALAYEMVGS
ncbi:MAG TPA: helix-turn-helix transcriptional regulator [Gaiellaceae bacterium]|nr:helix-turn-helix transcriptional regulator [Gaiellaceae bacterium]